MRAQAHVQDPDAQGVFIGHHVLDALDDIFVGADAVVAQHAHAQDDGSRGDTHIHTGGVVGDLAPDDAGHVGAMAVGINAFVLIDEAVAVVLLITFAISGAGPIPHEIGLAGEVLIQVGAEGVSNFSIEVHPTVQHGHGDALTGEGGAIRQAGLVQHIGAYTNDHRITQLPLAIKIGRLHIRAAIPVVRQVTEDDQFIRVCLIANQHDHLTGRANAWSLPYLVVHPGAGHDLTGGGQSHQILAPAAQEDVAGRVQHRAGSDLACHGVVPPFGTAG